MPFVLTSSRVRQPLVCILFCLTFPCFCHGLFALTTGRHIAVIKNGCANPDTVLFPDTLEWNKYYHKIRKKENRLKDTTRKKMLLAVLANLDTLKNSIQKYAIKHVDTGTGVTTYDIVDDVIIFNIPKNNISNFVHETTHGGQFQKGEIVFRDTLVPGWPDTAGGLGDDFGDEIAAYKAQFAFSPASVSDLPNSYRPAKRMKNIDPPWLIGLTDERDTTRHIYLPNGRDGVTERHINIYSGKKDMAEAYPKANISMTDNYMLGKDPHYLNFPAKLSRYRLTHQTAHDSPATPSSPPRSQ